MSILHRWLTLPGEKSKAATRFWFAFALTLAAIYGLLSLQQAFRGEYVIDSDARQHVYWMRRFLDPSLFPNDWITDYHESIAPSGYALLYHMAAKLGIDPVVFNKLLPPILGLIATGYCFLTAMGLFPVPAAAFVSTTLLNLILWTKYDLVSGTPRAFVYPILLAFCYYCLRRSRLGVGIAIVLAGTFYPQCIFVCSGVLVLQFFEISNGRLQLCKERGDRQLSFIGLGIAFLVMLPYAIQSSQFGPVISLEAAKTAPEFAPDGRTPFFHDNFLEFWIYGNRSGILPKTWLPPLVWLGLCFPLLWKWRDRFPLLDRVGKNIAFLAHLTLASVGMFFMAHLLLFRLHLPSRYTMHSLRIVLSLAAGIAIVALIDVCFRRFQKRRLKYIPIIAIVLCMSFLLFYPLFVKFPYHKYKQGEEPLLYEFFASQPLDILVAGLMKETSNIPSFSQRSVLLSPMYAIAYHSGYYNEIRQRTNDLIEAQYSPNFDDIRTFIDQYGIDFWMVDKLAYTPDYIRTDRWLMQFRAAAIADDRLQTGNLPALTEVLASCTVLETETSWILDTECIRNWGTNN